MKRRLRIICALWAMAAAACCSARANPLILAPSGTTLTTRQFRAEAAFSPQDSRDRYYWVSAGLAQFEISLIRHERPNLEAEHVLGAQWAFLPETYLTPAVGFGARDAVSDSAHRPAVYVAATKSIKPGKRVPIVKEIGGTVGLGIGSIRGPFFGLEARLPLNLFVQAEYDSYDLNAAGGWRPFSLLRLKTSLIHGELYFGAELLPISF